MVSELDIGRCASEEVEPRRGVDTRQCASKDARPEGGRLRGPLSIGEGNESVSEDAGPQKGRVDCEIPYQLGRRVWKLLLSKRVLKILRGSLKGKAQRGQ